MAWSGNGVVATRQYISCAKGLRIEYKAEPRPHKEVRIE